MRSRLLSQSATVKSARVAASPLSSRCTFGDRMSRLAVLRCQAGKRRTRKRRSSTVT